MKFFSKKKIIVTEDGGLGFDWDFVESKKELAFKNLVINTAVDFIARSFLSTDFFTFLEGEKFQGDNYYRLAIKANDNQNATEFWYKVIEKLIFEDEAVVVQVGQMYYLCDDFTITDEVLRERNYRVTIQNLKMNKRFKSSDVFHFRLSDKKIKNIIDNYYETSAKVIAMAVTGFRHRNGLKILAKIPALLSKDITEDTRNYYKKKYKDFFDNENSLMVVDGSEEIVSQSDFNEKSDSTALLALKNDFVQNVAMAFHIPRNVLMGDVAGISEQTDNFLTFALKPITKLIESEINAKLYSQEDYIKGSKLRISLSRVKYLDVNKQASALDVLFRTGTHSINDNRFHLDEERLDYDWADWYAITKNYEFINKSKGGENDEQI